MNYIASILSDNKGNGSSQRVAMMLAIVCVLTWASWIVYKTTVIPAIPDTWVWFIGLLVTGIAGDKTITAVKEVKSATSTVDATQAQ